MTFLFENEKINPKKIQDYVLTLFTGIRPVFIVVNLHIVYVFISHNLERNSVLMVAGQLEF